MDLVDLQEISKRLGVKPQTARQWRLRKLLPVPLKELAVGPIWEWEAIERWARQTGRLVEDPSKDKGE